MLRKRKTRRKIRRRERGKKRQLKKNSHLHAPITNIWTKLTTYFMILFEAVFVIWWIQETVLNWQELIVKFRNIVNIIGGWF